MPLHAAEHFYIVTEPIAELPRNLPVLRVPDECTYYKEDAGKLLVGAFEPVAKPWGMDGIPEDFCFDTLPEDIDHFEPILESATRRVPLLAKAGIQPFFNGPESFTPDDRYLLGETPEVRDLFVAAGFNSIGIQSSGGAGKVLAEWIRDGRMPMDLSDVDIRRMHPFQSNRSYLHDRTVETLGLLYAMHWPYRQHETARGVRRSPFHDRLVAAGAVMGETAGWERPNWFAPPGVEPEYHYSYGRQNWFEHSAAECRAVRDAVALFDQSSFAKFLVEGADACAVLNRISRGQDRRAGRPDRLHPVVQRARRHRGRSHRHAPGRDQLHGRHRCRRPDPRPRLAERAHPGRSPLRRDRRHLGPADARPHGSALARAAAEAVAATTCPTPPSRSAPRARSRSATRGSGPAGSPMSASSAGSSTSRPSSRPMSSTGSSRPAREFGLTLAGYHAMNACRIEKGYRHWGHDIGPEDTRSRPASASASPGTSRRLHRPRRAAARPRGGPRAASGAARLVDDSQLLYHDEPVWPMAGSSAGDLRHVRPPGRRAARHGLCALGASPARGWTAGGFEVEVAWERVPAEAQLAAWYDPRNQRIRG